MILYFETNFLAAVAFAREKNADELIRLAQNGEIQIVLPDVCPVEAWKVIEFADSFQQSVFRGIAGNLKELQHKDPRAAPDLLKHVSAAHDACVAEMDQSGKRLRDILERLSCCCLLAGASPAMLANPIMDDPADDLVLKIIQAHASVRSNEKRALVTEDKHFQEPEVKRTLRDAGVKLFSATEHFLEWYHAQSSPRLEEGT